MPVMPVGTDVPEPTEVDGAPMRRWRIVYSADMELPPGAAAGAAAPWPGRKDLVVDVAMPLFTEALPLPAASNGHVSAGGSSSRIIVGGDLKMDRLETRQVAVTVDTMDLDRSQAIRTDVTLVQSASPAFAEFFKSVVLPTTVRSENRLFAPPSFVYEDKEYTCKWIGRMARVQNDQLEHVYAQANDGKEHVVTRAVRRYVKGGPQDWVKEEVKSKVQVQQLLGLNEDGEGLAS
ncbi:hypothetical protein BCR44DRAFT_81419 [Catenaria anguillulae PL171]|uniref:Uncharacterized protein n=1 Tax=Catenaria anguillulae PL171 TaxID=765915 RepID=A0A1Y2HMA6_9FUNG|nr:hypothetical protein BCR44DRAFT_81419 [Catenaria anguillulae PL171]